MRVLRALGAMLRLLVMSALVAVLLLAGFMYLDQNGEFVPRLRAAAENVVAPEVVTAVEGRGSTVTSELTDLFGSLLGRIDQAVRGDGGRGVRGNSAAVVLDADTAAETHAVLDEINAYRRSEGLTPLLWDDHLADFAQERADDMITRGYFSHHDPETGQILLADLHSFVTVGENLYQITGAAVPLMSHIADKAVEGWRNSPSHNELMLDSRMDKGGIGMARAGTRIVVVLVASQ